MSVVARMRCSNVNLQQGWTPQTTDWSLYPQWARDMAESSDVPVTGTVTLQCIYDADQRGENAQWAMATPSGKLELQIQNPAALRQFEPGVDYVVEIRKRMPSRARGE